MLAELLSRIGISAKGIDGALIAQVRGTRVGSSFGEFGAGARYPRMR